MERETQEVILPSGIVAIFVAYLTGRDIRDISRAPLKSIKVQRQGDGDGVAPLLENVNLAQCGKDEEEALIKAAVLELDGSKENVFERLLDLRAEDWQFVTDEAKKLQTPTSK